jgi:hypothetical protein
VVVVRGQQRLGKSSLLNGHVQHGEGAALPRPPATTLPFIPPMSSTVTASSNFRSIFDAALSDYAKQTGIDLSTHPFAQTLQDSTSPDAIIDLLGDKAKQFQAYRDGNRQLINCLKPVVQVLHTVSGILGEAATLVSPSGSCCLI